MKTVFEKIRNVFCNSKSAVAAVISGCAAIILICSFFVYAASYTKILPNVHIHGMNVGGMTVDAAEAEVRNAFENIAKGRSVIVNCCGNQQTVAFDDLKVQIDSKKTAEAAYAFGREKGAVKKTAAMLKQAFKTKNIDLKINLDKAGLNKLIDQMAEGKEVAPTETGYVLEGNKLTIIKGHGGKIVNRDAAMGEIVSAATNPGAKEVSLALETILAKAPELDAFYQKLTEPVKNAEYVLEEGKVRIEPERIGIVVEKAKVKEALNSQQESYELEVETQIPETTAAELEKLLFRDNMGSFSSSFATSTAARASNVILTANRINGKILMPGDVFSYDSTIGRRTVANGYKEAGVYIGNKVESGIGGGICQTSSTLYSAVLYSNLEIVARTSHSLPVSYVPLGQDATIAEGYIDFKFKNNTDYPVKIVATVRGRRLTCSILGVKDPNISVQLVNTVVSTSEPKTERTENAEVPKGYKRILNKGAKGYTVASQRIVKESGKVIKTEKLTRSVYRAAPVEEEVNPEDKNTPTENLKIYVPGMEIPAEKPENTEEPKPEEKPEIKPDPQPEETEPPSVEESKQEETEPVETEDEIVNV